MDSIELGSNSQPASQPANQQQHQPSNHLRKNVGNCSSLCIYIMTESVRVFGMCPRPRHTQNLLHCRTSSEIGPGLLLVVFPRCVSKRMTPSKFNLHSSIAWHMFPCRTSLVVSVVFSVLGLRFSFVDARRQRHRVRARDGLCAKHTAGPRG